MCSFSKDGYCSGYSFSKSNTFIKQIAKIYTQEGLITEYYKYSGISDANILNGYGIQVINLTDGAKHPHTKDEQITVKDLESLTSIIIACIDKL